jgi:8-oxo-dGTP diphosphatase
MAFYRRGGEILIPLKKRGHRHGLNHAVGGKLETGETHVQALVRESREEVGLIPMNYWLVAELDYTKNDGDDPWHIHHRVYICDEWEGEAVETESMKPEWYAVENIPYDNMWQDNEFWLPQILAGNKVYGEFSYDYEEKLLSHNVEITDILPSEEMS